MTIFIVIARLKKTTDFKKFEKYMRGRNYASKVGRSESGKARIEGANARDLRVEHISSVHTWGSIKILSTIGKSIKMLEVLIPLKI